MKFLLQFVQKLIKLIFILPIKIYQIVLSPLFGANKCRYQPTCSYYMIDAIQEWGAFKGSWLGLKRIARCHPWGGWGDDPVPKRIVTEDK